MFITQHFVIGLKPWDEKVIYCCLQITFSTFFPMRNLVSINSLVEIETKFWLHYNCVHMEIDIVSYFYRVFFPSIDKLQYRTL